MDIRQNITLCRIATATVLLWVAISLPLNAFARVDENSRSIDPRLIEIVEQVMAKTATAQEEKLRKDGPNSVSDIQASALINAVNNVETSEYSKDAQNIRDAILVFDQVRSSTPDYTGPSLSRIMQLYAEQADLLEANATTEQRLSSIQNYIEKGSWFEKYYALSLSAQLHGENKQRQASLQNAQAAMALIPENQDKDLFVKYAKSRTTSIIAQLHNLQGNTHLAISTSLEYLRLTQGDPDIESGIDLINNLIFSHSMSRDHDAMLYLSEQLLEIEKSGSSTVPGLSEVRVSQVMNSTGNFDSSLNYANASLAKSTHPLIILQAQTNKAIALTGLGRVNEAMRVIEDAQLDLSPEYLLTQETSRDRLYLGFLLAQSQDTGLATKLFNRQIDVTSQKFLANNSRDTTAVLADLENSRERQVEREVAAAREARLQEVTLEKERKLNRALIGLTALFAMATIAAIFFARFRSKMAEKLKVKTQEAASAEKLKTEFLGMISHELRTPLNAIIGISDFLTQYHGDADTRKKTSIILKGGNDLLSVVESLTDMARIDADQMSLDASDVDLAAALSRIPEPWLAKAEAKGLTFTHFIDPAITSHHIDHKRLIQCINVIVSNAVQFTQEGRVHLHITAESNAVGEVIGLSAVVADTGRGMTELVQSRLFTPFMQADTSRKRNHMGTGLNLAIAYALAVMMGGGITVVSREGRGSEFKLSVKLGPVSQETELHTPETKIVPKAEPIQPPPATIKLGPPILDTHVAPKAPLIDLMKPAVGTLGLHQAEGDVSSAQLNSGFKILIVDDMEPNRDILRLMLETKGHHCDEASSGSAALRRLEENRYDLMILDVHMSPMDGIETLKRIRSGRSDYSNIPVVALTADSAPSINADCMAAGADLFLMKPVRQGELLQALTYLHKTTGVRFLAQTFK